MTRSETMKALREEMNVTIEEVSRVAREAKLRLENLDEANSEAGAVYDIHAQTTFTPHHTTYQAALKYNNNILLIRIVHVTAYPARRRRWLIRWARGRVPRKSARARR